MGLKEMRKNAGLTAREVAAAMGVTFQNVYNWEAGSYLPRAGQLSTLAKLYGCTVDELLSPARAAYEEAAQPGGGGKGG